LGPLLQGRRDSASATEERTTERRSKWSCQLETVGLRYVTQVASGDGSIDHQWTEIYELLRRRARAKPARCIDEADAVFTRSCGDLQVAVQLDLVRLARAGSHRRMLGQETVHRLSALRRRVADDNDALREALHCGGEGRDGRNGVIRHVCGVPGACDQRNVRMERLSLSLCPLVPSGALRLHRKAEP